MGTGCLFQFTYCELGTHRWLMAKVFINVVGITSYLIYNGSLVDYGSANPDQMPRFVAHHLDQRSLKSSPYITYIASKPKVMTL